MRLRVVPLTFEGVVDADDDDECALAGACRAEDRVAVGVTAVAHTPEDDPARINGDGIGDLVFARGEQNRAAKAIGVERQRLDGVDRRLDAGAVVAGDRGNGDFDGHIRNRHRAALVADAGVIEHAIA